MLKEIIPPIVGSLFGALATGAVTWSYIRSGLGQRNTILDILLNNHKDKIDKLNSDLKSVRQRAENLAHFEKKYKQVKSRLEASSVVKEYLQPVILVGPRAVGKSSLLAQWHAPWNFSRLDPTTTQNTKELKYAPTATHNTSTVPIYDFKQSNIEPHFADPDIKTDVHIHLKLKVHDFPGEVGAQESVIEQAIQETKNLRQSTGKADLGIVLICMFDAEEAATSLSKSTKDYYNGELFAKLRNLVIHNEIRLEKLLLVFNKYDLLKNIYPNENDKFLLDKCFEVFKPVIYPMGGICNSERVCPVFTSLSRETDMPYHNRGAYIVLGKAAIKFVEVMGGKEAVKEVIPETRIIYAGAPSYFL